MKTIFQKKLIFLNLFCLILTAPSITYGNSPHTPLVSMSIQKPFHRPKAKINLILTDDSEKPEYKWFNDDSNSDDTLIYNLNIILTNKLKLSYRKQKLKGIHSGYTAGKLCFLSACFWLDSSSGSIIKGLEQNDSIQYIVDNNEIWISRPFHINNMPSLTISPLAGINIIPSSLIFSYLGEQEEVNYTFPIPFTGVHFSKKLSKTLSITGELHYCQFNTTEWGIKFSTYQLGIEKDITPRNKISLGYQQYLLDFRYDKDDIDGNINLPLKSLFIKFSTSF